MKVRFNLFCEGSLNFFEARLLEGCKPIGWQAEVVSHPLAAAFSDILNIDSSVPNLAIAIHNPLAQKREFLKGSEAERKGFSERYANQVEKLALSLRNGFGRDGVLVQGVPAERDEWVQVEGDHLPLSWWFTAKQINLALQNLCRRERGLEFVDVEPLASSFGERQVFDSRMFYHADLPYSVAFCEALADEFLTRARFRLGHVTKCIVTDLDGVLWGGAVGELGWQKIELGHVDGGMVFVDLQLWLMEMKRRGILLAICSKNDVKVVKDAFESHPEMVLKWSDFSVKKISWQSKEIGIAEILQELRVSPSSVIFLDDSEFERNLVRSQFPGLVVPELSSDPTQYLSEIVRQNLIVMGDHTKEDGARLEMISTSEQRSQVQAKFSCEDDFLKSLKMAAKVEAFSIQNSSRVSQLSLRTNQFNLSSIRYDVKQVEALAEEPQVKTLAISLKDSFGSYGLVAAVILRKQAEEKKCLIENWFMSCRVIGRGLEKFVLNEIVKVAQSFGCDELVGQYLPTQRNAIVADLYSRFRFVKSDANWTLGVREYIPHPVWIEESSSP